MINVFSKIKSVSKKYNETTHSINEVKVPIIYPMIVLLPFFGNFFLPNFKPEREAAPSPIVAIKAAAANIPKGKKKTGKSANTIAAGFVNSKSSFLFKDFPNKSETLSGNIWKKLCFSKIQDNLTQSKVAKTKIPENPA